MGPLAEVHAFEGIPLLVPLRGFHAVVTVGEPFRQRYDSCDGTFRDTDIVRRNWDIGDENSVFGRGVEINVIDTDARFHNHFQLRHLLEDQRG
jgi:hypothetical protein